MATVIVVTSGKGGVGKTTSTAALGAALAQQDQNVVVVDFDVGLRNLDLVMGAERRVVFDLINVVQGDAKLPQALIRDKRIDTLSLLPASQTRDKDALTAEGVTRVIDELREKFDWVICDSPAGIERGATLAMRHADVAVVVTNPEVSSVRDSDRIIGMLDSKTAKAEKGERIEKHLLLTRYDAARAARGEMLKIEDVLEILSIPLLGIIPESEEVLRASNLGAPVTIGSPNSAAAKAYFEAARRLKGETLVVTVPARTPQLHGTTVRPEGRCMNLMSLFRRRDFGAGCARATAGAAGARARVCRQVRSAGRAAGGDHRGHRQARDDRARARADQARPRRSDLDSGDRRGGAQCRRGRGAARDTRRRWQEAEPLLRRQQRDGEFCEDRLDRQLPVERAQAAVADPVAQPATGNVFRQMQRRGPPDRSGNRDRRLVRGVRKP